MSVKKNNKKQKKVLTKTEKTGNKVTIVGFISLFVTIGIILGAYIYGEYRATIPETVKSETIATVDGREITSDLFTYTFFNLKSSFEQEDNITAEQAREYWTRSETDGKRALEVLEEATKTQCVGIVTMLADAENRGISLTAEEINENRDEVTAQLKSQFGDKKSYDKEIGDMYHISEEAFMQLQTETIPLYNKYMEELTKEYEDRKDVEDAKYKDARDYYKKNEVTQYSTTTVKHCLFLTTDSNTMEALDEKSIKKAENKARETLKKVRRGANFDKLIKKLSEDSGKAENNGVYEVNAEASLVQEFKDFAFEHKVGATGVVETSYGYHVMQVVDRKLDKTFKKVKEECETAVQNSNIDAYLEGLVKDLEATDYNEDFLIRVKSIVITEDVPSATTEG